MLSQNLLDADAYAYSIFFLLHRWPNRELAHQAPKAHVYFGSALTGVNYESSVPYMFIALSSDYLNMKAAAWQLIIIQKILFLKSWFSGKMEK